MATELVRSQLQAIIGWNYTSDSDTDDRLIVDASSMSKTITLTDGTGANNAKKPYHKRLSLVDATPTNVDLYGGITDAFGTTINFTAVKTIYIINLSTTATDFVLIGGTFKTWMDTGASASVKLYAGGVFAISNPTAAGYAVTSGSADVLSLTADGNDFDVDIYVDGIE